MCCSTIGLDDWTKFEVCNPCLRCGTSCHKLFASSGNCRRCFGNGRRPRNTAILWCRALHFCAQAIIAIAYPDPIHPVQPVWYLAQLCCGYILSACPVSMSWLRLCLVIAGAVVAFAMRYDRYLERFKMVQHQATRS